MSLWWQFTLTVWLPNLTLFSHFNLTLIVYIFHSCREYINFVRAVQSVYCVLIKRSKLLIFIPKVFPPLSILQAIGVMLKQFNWGMRGPQWLVHITRNQKMIWYKCTWSATFIGMDASHLDTILIPLNKVSGAENHTFDF